MVRTAVIALILAGGVPLAVATPAATTGPVAPAARSGGSVLTGTYDRLVGGRIDLAALRGRVVLVVNTASRCGFTRQYASLETLWRTRRAEGVTVVGVPSHDFKQELPSNGEVVRFCTRNFGVSFPMLRISTVTGPRAIRLFTGLAAPSWSGAPTWNFTKYLIDRQGRPAMRLAPSITPDSPTMTAAINALLAERGIRRGT